MASVATSSRGPAWYAPAVRPIKKQSYQPETKVVAAQESPRDTPRHNKPLSFTLKLDATHPYLQERDISASTIKVFDVGVADRGMMKGRMAIPIHNEDGQLIAYAGRWADKDVPKNTPKYLLPEGFEKQSVLFNLHRLPEDTRHVVMVESYFSVFKLHELGIPVVSPMGRSVSADQAILLQKAGINRITLLFDGDDAGRSGRDSALAMLAKKFWITAPVVPADFKPHRSSGDEITALLAQPK